MKRSRRRRPAALLAALGLGGFIAAASASQAAAFDAGPPGPSTAGHADGATQLPLSMRMHELIKPVMLRGIDYDVATGGLDRSSASRMEALADAIFDLPSEDASGKVRSFMYPVDGALQVFFPPPPAVFAGGNAPGSSSSIDAMLDLASDD